MSGCWTSTTAETNEVNHWRLEKFRLCTICGAIPVASARLVSRIEDGRALRVQNNDPTTLASALEVLEICSDLGSPWLVISVRWSVFSQWK